VPLPQNEPIKYVERPSYILSYEKWADDRLRWWDEQHIDLLNFLNDLDEGWNKQREESLKYYDTELSLNRIAGNLMKKCCQ
jgi:hypothetical protein